MIPFSLHSVKKDGEHATEKIDHIMVVMFTVSVSRGRPWSSIFVCYLAAIGLKPKYVVTVASFF